MNNAPTPRPLEYFTKADFDNKPFEPLKPEVAAALANLKYEALLSTGVRVWGLEEKKVWYVGESDANDTHTALLINIQPIEKPECREHELGATHFDADTKIYRYECKHCGTELEKIVTWKEKGGEHG